MSFKAPTPGYASSRAGQGGGGGGTTAGTRPTFGQLPPLNLNLARGVGSGGFGRGANAPGGTLGSAAPAARPGDLSATHDILDTGGYSRASSWRNDTSVDDAETGGRDLPTPPPPPPPPRSGSGLAFSPNTLSRPLPSPVSSAYSNSPSPSPTMNAFPSFPSFHLPTIPHSSSGISLSTPLSTTTSASAAPTTGVPTDRTAAAGITKSSSQPTITRRNQRTSSLIAASTARESPVPPSPVDDMPPPPLPSSSSSSHSTSTSTSSLSTISNRFNTHTNNNSQPNSTHSSFQHPRSHSTNSEREIFSGPGMSKSSSASSAISSATAAGGGGSTVVGGAEVGAGSGLNRDETVKRRKPNPLEDLIRTENLYVADLAVIIKRVAAAWSRSNFPPAALDGMFRCVEAVYRVNKGLLAKLNEIGPSPSSPKELGDLLMRWITDLDPAYTRYTTSFHTSFDLFIPVQTNPNLAPILSQLPWPATLPLPSSASSSSSTSSPSSNSPDSPSSSSPTRSPPLVTLDTLFSLPIERIKYYKKLYSRLLRSTQEGRSDHALLVGANERLDVLEENWRGNKDREVGEVEERYRRKRGSGSGSGEPEGIRTGESSERSSGESSGKFESDRYSSATNTTSTSMTNLSVTPRIEDLERRLNTERTLDIFTMLPKKCKLQMAPPNLPYSRQIRRASDVSVSFTPLSDPSRRVVVIRRAYIFLLTDLFLVCERMTTEERHQVQLQSSVDGASGAHGPDMWLLYPPLAGKHLRVTAGESAGELEVVVMKKEKLFIRTESPEAADAWRSAFEEAIAFGTSRRSLLPFIPLTRGPRLPSLSPLILRYLISGKMGSWLADFDVDSWFQTPDELTWQPFSTESMLAARSNSTSSNGDQSLRSPLSPANLSQPIAAPSPSFPSPSPSTYQSNTFPSQNGAGSPLPASPLSSGQSHGDIRSSPEPSLLERPLPPPHSDQNVGMGLPGRQYDRSQDGARRAFSAGEVVAPPPRKQSTGLSSSEVGGGGRMPHSSSPTPPPMQGYPQQGYDRQPSPLGDRMQPSPLGDRGQNVPYPNQHPNEQPYYDPQQQHHQQNNGYPQPLHKSTSSRSTGSISSRTDRSSGHPHGYVPPLPGKEAQFNGNGSYPTSRRTDPGRSSHISGGLLSPGGSMHRSRSAEGLHDSHYRMPSQAILSDERSSSAPGSTYGQGDYSPPPSPVGGKQPQTTIVVAQMRCKAFLQQNHSQWKSLGTAKLKVFVSMPNNTKQLVVESDKSDKKVFVSTIVLTDGVERVGKTGVAIELSDNGNRTGIIYMLQMKTEQSATGLFDELLKGSDREGRRSRAM